MRTLSRYLGTCKVDDRAKTTRRGIREERHKIEVAFAVCKI